MGWRALGLSWVAVLATAGLGAAGLQMLGAPAPPAAKALPAPKPEFHPLAKPATLVLPAPAPAPSPATTEASGAAPVANGAIPPPQPALLEPAPDFPGAELPRTAADGRMSMRVYARATDPADKRPRLAMLVVGFGLSAAASKAALDLLPQAVDLGISPYTHDRTGLPDAIRAAGHEYLVTLPMESQSYPLNDSGPHALLTGAEPGENDRNLEWVLSRVQGEVGVTGASDGLLGERFAASLSGWAAVRDELARRGLLYVDSRPGVPVSGAAVGVSVVVDDPPDQASIDAKLARLEQQARDRGVAVGVAGTLRPVTVERIASWARGLDGRGIDLVPVSALVPLPAAPPAPAAPHE